MADGLFWWRVEFNADGSIKSLDDVEMAGRDGNLICFVQATTQESAIERGKAWLNRRWKAKQAARGLCRDCPQPVKPGRKRCEFHLRKVAQDNSRMWMRRHGPELLRKFDEMGADAFREWLMSLASDLPIAAE